MSLETVFTVMLIIGIAALTVWLFSRALRTAIKFLCNGAVGIVLLLALHWIGLPLPVNGVTLLFTFFTGGCGVILMLLYSLLIG